MSEVEVVIDMPAEYSSMVFGQFDEYAKAIESNLNIELIARDGVVKIIGAEANVIRARGVLDNLIELARRGNQISRQSVDYAISLSFDDKQDTMLEIDSDTVCRTIAGKPIKPKTLGQKNYVDQIRDKMIVFGIGPAGTGKTEGARAIAAGLNLPYMKYTCSAGTEIFDLVGQVFPDTDGPSTGDADLDQQREQLKEMGGITYENVKKLMGLPDLDDMDYDPAGTYQKLSGMEKPDATSQDCMSLVMEMVTNKLQQLCKVQPESSDGRQTFTYIETDFIRALKHGYLVELQEPTTIIQPGVLVGLNSLLEQKGSITLPTGEVIHRHPDAVVVVTTNVSYEGCRGVNQSVLDRMNLTQDIELPEPEIMAQRAMSITGCEDDVLVGRMVQVVCDMADYCRKNGISDGNCGMRSLIDWIMSTEITGDPYTSARYTIVSKATSDEEDRSALLTTVLEPIFAPKQKKAV